MKILPSMRSHAAGGIAISGPASRFDLDKFAALRDVTQRQASKLSRELGGVL